MSIKAGIVLEVIAEVFIPLATFIERELEAGNSADGTVEALKELFVTADAGYRAAEDAKFGPKP